jgi:hypothetical protein
VARAALEFFARIDTVTPRAAEPLRKIAAQLADELEAIADSTEPETVLTARSADLYERYQQWNAAWSALENLHEVKSPPEITRIIDAASRKSSLWHLSYIASSGKDCAERWEAATSEAGEDPSENQQ